MFDNIQPTEQESRDIDDNRAHWAQESPSGTVTEFSQPHIHNDGSYGFDGYEYDSAGKRVNDDHTHYQFGGDNQSSLQAYGVEQQPLIGGKLDQQAQNQFGGVDTTQQNLNQY
jgi:hypothetical protein